jgi:hypothetical protein
VLRDKRFLTGLGAGLMIGAILLQLMNAAAGLGSPGDRNAAGLFNLPDRAQLEEDASLLGLVLHDAKETWYTQEEVDALLREARSGTEAEESGTSAERQPSVGSASDITSVQSDVMPHFFLIDIRSGMSSDEVGRMLQAAGLVDDLDAYRQEMEARGLDVKIRAGTYTFAFKPEISDLIDAITLKSGR